MLNIISSLEGGSGDDNYLCPMVNFERYVLENGLTVLLHQDKSTPLAAVNVLYKVGSKDDHHERTGYAHLFEHLMFEGTKNAHNFDTILQKAGGESNAFTNQDLTNYYNILPAENLETALWLEADRMFGLELTEEKVAIQKKVVVEEFAETCLNVPFGMVWHDILEKSYRNHGYQWPTIGTVPEHISEATFDDVSAYHSDYYQPDNAILVVAGGFEIDDVKELVEKHFNVNSPASKTVSNHEMVQLKGNRSVIAKREPSKALYITFHAPERMSESYYTSDLISDILGGGRTSKLFQAVIKDEPLFSDIDAYVTGTVDAGMLIVEGRVLDPVSMAKAEAKIWQVIESLQTESVPQHELQKLINKIETNIAFSEVNVLNRAISLAFFEYIGDANQINTQVDLFAQVTAENVLQESKKWLTKENANVFVYE